MSNMLMAPEFLEQVKAFRADWYKFYQKVSKEPTPQIDGNGKQIIKRRPDGKDYIVETYMRDKLDQHFPGWSWEQSSPLQFLGSEWVVAQGHLIIIDERLKPFGVNPPLRKFFGTDAVRIQYKKDMPHTAENIIDVGDNCKQANTAALKYAINRLGRIGDDVYAKRLEYEGAGTFDNIVELNPNATSFGNWVESHKGNWVEILKILGIKTLEGYDNWDMAYKKVKEAKKW